MEQVLVSNPRIMHGEFCFTGTRVSVQTLFDHLEAGYTIDGFIEQFPTVRREQVVQLLELLSHDVERVATAVSA